MPLPKVFVPNAAESGDQEAAGDGHQRVGGDQLAPPVEERLQQFDHRPAQ